MKRIIIICLFAVTLLCGCRHSETPPADISQHIQETTVPTMENIPAEESPTDTASIPLYAVSVPAITETHTAQNGTVVYAYTAQHMQLIHPNEEIADKVILDFLNRVDAANEDAANVFASAQADFDPDVDWRPYFYQMLYSPTRIDRGVLSLFGTQSSFSGGMHGSKNCIAANYDLLTGDPLTLGSIMHMKATKEDYVAAIIAKLDDMAQTYYLYDDYADGVYTRFSIDVSLYEDFYFTDSGLCFFFSPYEIAPYSSGVITVELPYQELTGMIYDGYFPDEHEQMIGAVHASALSEINLEQFNSMAEVVIDSNGETLIVYPEGSIADITVNIPDSGNSLPGYTVFRAYQMSESDAVVLYIPEDWNENLSVSYLSGETIVTLPLAE